MNTIELIDKAIETHETLATINEKEKQLDKSMKEYKEMTKKCSHIGVDLGLYKGHLIKRCLLCCQTLFDKKNEPPHPIIKAFKYNDTPTETKEEINERYKEIFFALVSLGKTNDLSKELIDNSINTHKLFKDIEEAERFLQTNRPIYKKTAHDCQHIGLHLGNNSEKDSINICLLCSKRLFPKDLRLIPQSHIINALGENDNQSRENEEISVKYNEVFLTFSTLGRENPELSLLELINQTQNTINENNKNMVKKLGEQ